MPKTLAWEEPHARVEGWTFDPVAGRIGAHDEHGRLLMAVVTDRQFPDRLVQAFRTHGTSQSSASPKDLLATCP